MSIKEEMQVNWKDYEYLLSEIKRLQKRIDQLEYEVNKINAPVKGFV